MPRLVNIILLLGGEMARRNAEIRSLGVAEQGICEFLRNVCLLPRLKTRKDLFI